MLYSNVVDDVGLYDTRLCIVPDIMDALTSMVLMKYTMTVGLIYIYDGMANSRLYIVHVAK